jgi:glutamine amidotransferase
VSVALVDSGGCNLGSVRAALRRLGVEAPLVADVAGLRAAERVILPGVGAAGPAVARLRELGLLQALRDLQKPLLGICLGMQLLFESSEEGSVECLGLLPGRVRRLKGTPDTRVPHMGWNALDPLSPSVLLEGLEPGAQAYFVHGYAAPVTADCVAACRHGEVFAAVAQRDWIAGTQFHPERSSDVGALVLRNFLERFPP